MGSDNWKMKYQAFLTDYITYKSIKPSTFHLQGFYSVNENEEANMHELSV